MRHFAPVETPAVADFIFQAAAVDALHGVIQIVILLAITEELDNIRMSQLFQRVNLSLKPQAKTGIGGDRWREHLNGDNLVRLGVDGFIDRAHASLAELLSDLIRSELFRLHSFIVAI